MSNDFDFFNEQKNLQLTTIDRIEVDLMEFVVLDQHIKAKGFCYLIDGYFYNVQSIVLQYSTTPQNLTVF